VQTVVEGNCCCGLEVSDAVFIAAEHKDVDDGSDI